MEAMARLPGDISLPQYMDGKTFRAESKKMGGKSVTYDDQQLCHKLPNDILVQAYNTTTDPRIKLELLKFAYSDSNIICSTKNEEHTRMENAIKADRATQEQMDWKGGSIIVALEHMEYSGECSEKTMGHLLKTIRHTSRQYNELVSQLDERTFNSQTVKKQINTARRAPPTQHKLQKAKDLGKQLRIIGKHEKQETDSRQERRRREELQRQQREEAQRQRQREEIQRQKQREEIQRQRQREDLQRQRQREEETQRQRQREAEERRRYQNPKSPWVSYPAPIGFADNNWGGGVGVGGGFGGGFGFGGFGFGGMGYGGYGLGGLGNMGGVHLGAGGGGGMGGGPGNHVSQRAPAGGMVSPVNGKFYKGGQFMPVP